MKYRLYGKEGVTEREIQKLKQWGVIRKNLDQMKQIRVKKRVKKSRVNSEGLSSYYTSDDSRSCDEAYEFKFETVYIDNEKGDPEEVNMGFEI